MNTRNLVTSLGRNIAPEVIRIYLYDLYNSLLREENKNKIKAYLFILLAFTFTYVVHEMYPKLPFDLILDPLHLYIPLTSADTVLIHISLLSPLSCPSFTFVSIKKNI